MKQQKNLIKQSGGGQLSDLEHFIAYDAQADKIHVKPLPSYFIVTTSGATTNSMFLRNEGGSEGNNIALENGENKIENADYGFVCKSVGNNTIISFDFFKYKTSNVTNMQSMFDGCSGLTTLDLSSFDTSNVTNMNQMFRDCTSLTSLDLSNFDTSNVTKMYNMFNGCSKLSKIKCKQAFKDWCIKNRKTISLPDTMISGSVGAVGSGSNWEIVDLS